MNEIIMNEQLFGLCLINVGSFMIRFGIFIISIEIMKIM